MLSRESACYTKHSSTRLLAYWTVWDPKSVWVGAGIQPPYIPLEVVPDWSIKIWDCAWLVVDSWIWLVENPVQWLVYGICLVSYIWWSGLFCTLVFLLYVLLFLNSIILERSVVVHILSNGSKYINVKHRKVGFVTALILYW